MFFRRKKHKPKRTPLQRVIRAAAWVGLTLLAAYVCLPLWAPTGLIRDYLADDLSRQLGVDVRIDTVSLSWSGGVEIRNLQIDSPEGFDDRPMIIVPRILADLAPIEMLTSKQIAWMVIESPQVFAEIRSDGKLNLSSLEKLHFDIETQRISVRQAQAEICLPQHESMLKVQIHDAEFFAGQVQQLGRVTMSAALDQDTRWAPVSLRLSASNEPDVAANAVFNFANIELASLKLDKLLGLPLQKLNGLCRGSLELQVDSQGIVDSFSFRVQIRNLDAQPVNGPKLPVIDEAYLRIAAAYDPLIGHLNIQSASVRLPGIDLTGRAELHRDVWKGSWQSISELELEGQIRLDQLSALLGRQAELPGEFRTTGPLNVQLSIKQDEMLVRTRLSAQGDEITIHRGAIEIKPAGEPLGVTVTSKLDLREWRLEITDAKLHAGENEFVATGQIEDLRKLARQLDPRNGPPSLRAMLRSLALAKGRGEWHIRDWASLGRLIPADTIQSDLSDVSKSIQPNSAIHGEWSLHQPGQPDVQLSVSVPAGIGLTVGQAFAKPVDSELRLELAGSIDRDSPAMNDCSAKFLLGDGVISVDNASLALSAGDSPDHPIVAIKGDLQAASIEAILQHLPVANRLMDSAVRGDIRGHCEATIQGNQSRAKISFDLTDVDIRAGRAFVKPAGDEAKLSVSLLFDFTDANPRCQAVIIGEMPGAAVALTAIGPKQPLRCSGKATFFDASRLEKLSPFIADALAGGQLSGRVEIEGDAKMIEDNLKVVLNCNADELAMTGGGKLKRRKNAGTPLQFELKTQIDLSAGEPVGVDVDRLFARLGSSEAELSGHLDLPDAKPHSATQLAYPTLPVQANGRVSLHFDDALLDLLPELAALARKHSMSGLITASASIRAEQQEYLAEVRLDASQFAMGEYRLKRSADANAEQLQLQLQKPISLPAGGEIQLSASSDLTRIRLKSAAIKLGQTQIDATGLIHLGYDASVLKPRPTKAAVHVVMQTGPAEQLVQLAPELKRFQPTGNALLTGNLLYGPSGWKIASVDLSCEKLSARHAGKDISIAGALSLREICLDQDKNVTIGSLNTDGLELYAGDNHGWLIAELTNLPHKPTGRFDLLIEHLDTQDLSDWLSGEPARSADTQPASEPFALTPKQAAALAKDAENLLKTFRESLGEASLDGRVCINRFKTFDPSVEQSYEVRHLELNARAKRGRISLAYAGGLNGGTTRGRYSFDLDEDTPIVAYETSLRDLVATKNIQPQLARYFPGNTVSGLFNRTETSTIPLTDLLANTLDFHHQLHPVGRAETIATDGLLIGRAAPGSITRIFPGLNMAEYRYKKMTSYATFHPDGWAENDMVFRGSMYDTYINGTTDANNIGNYELGLILLGTPQSADWNHRYRQGRIPLFRVNARIEGGKMHDEKVTYLWPNETLFVVFLENNIFYRLWLNAQKNRPSTPG